MDVVVPTRTVRCFSNNIPWITSHIKDLLNQKKRAFRNGDQEQLRRIQKELKVQLKEAKDIYRWKVEQKLQQNSTREVWDGMKTITGYCSKRGSTVEGYWEKANQLNKFFNRFDCPSPTAVTCPRATPQPPPINTAGCEETTPSSPFPLSTDTSPPPDTLWGEKYPPFSAYLYSSSGEWRAEEATHQQSSRA